MQAVFKRKGVLVSQHTVKKGKKEISLEGIIYIEVSLSELYDFLNREPCPINVKITFSVAPKSYKKNNRKKNC